MTVSDSTCCRDVSREARCYPFRHMRLVLRAVQPQTRLAGLYSPAKKTKIIRARAIDFPPET